MLDDDSYPTVDDIHNYVAIGLNKDVSISVEKETFDGAFIITTIILFIVFISIIIILIILNNNITYAPVVYNPAIPKKPAPLTVNDDYGSSKNGYTHNLYRKQIPDGENLTKEQCLLNNNKWDDTNNNCQCAIGKFGTTCESEFYDYKYKAVGNIKPNDIKAAVIGTYKTKYKSFKKNNSNNNSSDILDESCSNLCDKNYLCNAFFYHNHTNKCILYKNNIIIPDILKLKYSMNTDSTLYTKSLSHLDFTNLIFLSASEFTFQKRYWLFKNNKNLAKIESNIVSHISFIPTYIKYNYDHIGIYSSYEFQYKDIESILIETNDYNPNYYIHLPHNEFYIPNELLREDSEGLYVLYIKYIT
jgi:hypothetical protein